MRLFELAAILASGVNLALAVFVFTHASRIGLHRAYGLWGAGIALWNIGAYFLYQPIGPDFALFWAKILQLGIIIAPIGLFQLSYLVSKKTPPIRFLRCIYVLHTLFALSLPGDWFVTDVQRLPYGYWCVPGPLFWVYMASYSVLTVTPVIRLYISQKTAVSLHRTQLRSLLLAIFIIWIAGSNDLLPILGFNKYPLLNLPCYPLGSIAALIHVTIVGYSVLQHELLDVHVVLGRVAAHAVRLLFVLLVGACLLLILYAVAPGEYTPFVFFSSLGVITVSAVVASVFFPRLFGSGGDSLERRLLGDRFEYHDKIRNFTASMQWYSDSDTLMNDFHNLLTFTMDVESYQIVLLDETKREFVLFRAHPSQSDTTLPALDSESPIFKYFQRSETEYLALASPPVSTSNRSLAQEARDLLAPSGAAFCFPFFFEEEPFGLLLIGAKKSRDPFTATDAKLLSALVKSLGLIINQIRLKNQILQVQELDLLGRMSRGMAHDLNNLLTPVHTLLQLASEGATSESLNEELLPVALRNIATMRAYIREALFFSQNLRPDIQLGRLDVLIASAIELVRVRADRREVTFKASGSDEVRIEMDSVLIERLITNLISNAVDASPRGATVEIDLLKLPRTESQRDWFRIRIRDSGEGISEENMNRVFAPYFTTKKTGDESRGFGLGLAICRKIVHLHGGSMNLSSQPDRGTTVFVDLPARQAKESSTVPHGRP